MPSSRLAVSKPPDLFTWLPAQVPRRCWTNNASLGCATTDGGQLHRSSPSTIPAGVSPSTPRQILFSKTPSIRGKMGSPASLRGLPVRRRERYSLRQQKPDCGPKGHADDVGHSDDPDDDYDGRDPVCHRPALTAASTAARASASVEAVPLRPVSFTQ